MTKALYVVKKDVVRGGYYVQPTKGGKPVFYGTKTECDEWVEYNGHDAWN